MFLFFYVYIPVFDYKITYSHWHTKERSCGVSQLSMLAKGLACRLGRGNTFRLKSQFFCEPAIFISANLRKNTPKLVHNMCFSLTSITINLYQANCRKTLDQSYGFFNFILWDQIFASWCMCHHHIAKGHPTSLKYRLVTKNNLAVSDFFCGVWELRVALFIFLKLAQVHYSQH